MKTLAPSTAKLYRRAHRRRQRLPAHHWSMKVVDRDVSAARRRGGQCTCAVGSEARRCGSAQKERERSPHHTHRAPLIPQTTADGNCCPADVVDIGSPAPPDEAARTSSAAHRQRGHRRRPTLASRRRAARREKSAILRPSQPPIGEVATVVQ